MKNTQDPGVLSNEFRVESERETSATRLLADQDFITAVAGRVMELAAHDNLYIGREGQATEPLVLGSTWESLMGSILDIIRDHTHSTALGPTGTTLPPHSVTIETTRAQLPTAQSDWAFTQKTAPSD